MQNATMLYKVPGPHFWEGVAHDYLIVDKSDNQDFEAAIQAGWSLTIAEAVRRKNDSSEKVNKSAKKKTADGLD